MLQTGLLRYHIVGTLWVGHSTIVYRATAPGGELVAVKMLQPDAASSRRQRRAMDREARVHLRLRHPHIVRAIEYIPDAPMPALVMEYVAGDNVKSTLQRDPAFIRQHAKPIVLQACRALEHVHAQGLVHRDIKPENLLVAKDGTTKLIDFALAQPVGRARSLFRRQVAGTRVYIAPETIRREPPDFRTDIYSLGVTLYEMLTGRAPFVSVDEDELLRKHLTEPPPPMRPFEPDVSAEMEALVAAMLSKRRAARPANMAEVRGRLEAVRVFDKEGLLRTMGSPPPGGER